MKKLIILMAVLLSGCSTMVAVDFAEWEFATTISMEKGL